MLYRVDNWKNERSGWIVKFVRIVVSALTFQLIDHYQEVPT